MFTLNHPIVDVAIICSDFEKSLHFYRDMLGLTPVLDIEIPSETAVGANLAPSGFRQVRLKAGETLIKLVEMASPPAARTLEFQAGVRWLTFLIDDVPAAVEALTSKGVKFSSSPVSAPDAKYVVCAEAPDGILIELVQVR
jgi:glyoxylase I family protein